MQFCVSINHGLLCSPLTHCSVSLCRCSQQRHNACGPWCHYCKLHETGFSEVGENFPAHFWFLLWDNAVALKPIISPAKTKQPTSGHFSHDKDANTRQCRALWRPVCLAQWRCGLIYRTLAQASKHRWMPAAINLSSGSRGRRGVFPLLSGLLWWGRTSETEETVVQVSFPPLSGVSGTLQSGRQIE